VLAPASCQLFADVMLGRTPIIDPTPYSPAGRLWNKRKRSQSAAAPTWLERTSC